MPDKSRHRMRHAAHRCSLSLVIITRTMKIILLSCMAFFFGAWHVVADGTNYDWKLVRSVPNPFGGTNDYVLIPKDKIGDLTNYQAAATAIAGARERCFIFFWADRAHIPTSAEMAVTDMQVMTATYERNPNYKTPQLRLACWLYPSVEAARRANAFFMPGVKVPKAEATTNKAPDVITKP